MQTLTIYHPNAKGTGSALKLTPIAASDVCQGRIILGIARQTSTGNEVDGEPTFPRFDWDNQIEVRLDPIDVMETIRVFRGIQESINDGKGLMCKKCVLNMRHCIDPVPRYELTITKMDGETRDTRAFSLKCAEGEMLELCLSQIMGMMVFGR